MFGVGIGTIIKGFFATIDLAKRFLVFVQLRQAKQEGRTERDLEVQKETVEVISRNAEGVQEADEMSEEERRRRLTDGS